MAKEKKLNGNVISRRFSTMLPLDVFVDLNNFTKQWTKTGLDKFDYGVALRILLRFHKFSQKMDDIEQYIMDVEARLDQPQPKPVEETQSPKTFGTKLMEVYK